MQIQKHTVSFARDLCGSLEWRWGLRQLPRQNHMQVPGATHKHAQDLNFIDFILAAQLHA